MKTCPVCDGSLKREDNFITYKYKNYTKEIMQSGEYCTKCGEAFLSSKDLKASQKEIADCSRRSHSDTPPINTRTASRFVLGHLADEYSDSFC